MKRSWQLWALIGLAVLFIAVVLVVLHARTVNAPKGSNVQQDNTPFVLTSPAFAPGGSIPVKYTCKSDDVSPPLRIKNIPPDTVSLALVLHDPDAPGGDFLHWIMWNINPNQTVIGGNSVPDGAAQGTNDFGRAQYGGPCPPSGTHRYVFDLYALSTKLNLPAGANRQQFEHAIENYIVAQTTLIGTFQAE